VRPTLTALADPARRQILEILRTGPCNVGDLVGALGISQPGVSKHLRVLRTAGLVDARPLGPQRVYALRAEPLQELDDWLSPYRDSWLDAGVALQRHLERRD
jgi:DNA-binding transcriptional ArsR family regulator